MTEAYASAQRKCLTGATGYMPLCNDLRQKHALKNAGTFAYMISHAAAVRPLLLEQMKLRRATWYALYL